MPEIERVFAQLGMTPAGSMPTVPSYQNLLPKIPSVEEAIAEQLARQQPEAIDRHGPMAQFLYGVSSPVMGVAKVIGLTKKKIPRPQGLLETVANIAGGILGWGTLLMPFAGSGIQAAGGAAAAGIGGAVAAGAAKQAVAKAAVGAIAKGAAMGALTGANEAWMYDEPLGERTLKSLVWGAAFGAAGFGLQQFLQKAGKVPETTRKLLEQAIDERHPILTTTAPGTVAEAKRFGYLLKGAPEGKVAEAMERINMRLRNTTDPLPSYVHVADTGVRVGSNFNKLSDPEKAQVLMAALRNHPEKDTILEPILDVVNATTAAPSLMRAQGKHALRIREIVSATEKIELPQINRAAFRKGTTAYKALERLDQAKNFGEQLRAFNSFRLSTVRSQREILKKWDVSSYEELLTKVEAADTAKAVMRDIRRYADRHAALQDLNWAMGNRVSSILSLDPSVNLPSLEQVRHTLLSEAGMKSLKTADNIPWELELHPELGEVLENWNAKTGKSYTDYTFKPKEMQEEWNKVVQELKDSGQPIYVRFKGMTAIGTDLSRGQHLDYLDSLASLPDGVYAAPANLQEAAMLKKELMPIIGRHLTPVWRALGPTFYKTTEPVYQSHLKYVDQWTTVVRDWIKRTGLKGGKEITQTGVRVSRALDGRLPETTLNSLSRAASRLVNLKPEQLTRKVIREIAEDAGVSTGMVRRIKEVISGLSGDDLKALRAMGGSEMLLARQHLIGAKLKGAAKLFAGDTISDEAHVVAKQFGLRNADELKIAVEARQAFDRLFKEAGFDPDRYIASYYPRFRDLSGKNYDQIVKSFKDAGLPEKQIQGYLWMNDLHRTTELAYEYEEDFFRAFLRYVTGYSKMKHFDKHFEHWNKVFKRMAKSGEMAGSRLQVYEDLKAQMLGRPGWLEKEIDRLIVNFANMFNMKEWVGERPTQAISAILADLQHSGGVGYNLFTAIKNLTQKGLSLTEIADDGNWYTGAKYILKAKRIRNTPQGKYLLNHCKILKSRVFLEGLDNNKAATVRWMERLGFSEKVTDVAQKAHTLGFKAFRWSDEDNVIDTFLAKALYLIEQKGAPLQDAVELATSTVMATQFVYGFGSPMLYKTPVGKQLGIFMSWPINWAFMLYEQGTRGDMRKAIATVGLFAIGSEVLSMTGLSFRSINPIDTARGILPIALMEGEDRYPLALRSAAAINQYIRALVDGDPEAIDTALDNLKRRLRPMVPAGVMAGRVLDFIDVVKNEWRSYDRKGRLRYETTPGEAFRSLIGPTTEAAKRVEDWQRVSRMESYYRRMRNKAIDAFIRGDYRKFERLQEQLIVNFGRWIEPADIRYELRLREMTARERQLISMPQTIRGPYFQSYGK